MSLDILHYIPLCATGYAIMIKAWSLLLPNAAFPLLINWSPKKIPWYPNITKSAPNLYQIDPSTSVIIWPLQELATANRPYHKECQVGCQIDCQIKCQKECQKDCQIECQIKCQIEIDDSFHHPKILCHFIGHFIPLCATGCAVKVKALGPGAPPKLVSKTTPPNGPGGNRHPPSANCHAVHNPDNGFPGPPSVQGYSGPLFSLRSQKATSQSSGLPFVIYIDNIHCIRCIYIYIYVLL